MSGVIIEFMSKTETLATFYIISPPSNEDGKTWAKKVWDTYGFDYDLERTGQTVFAWACDVSDEELQSALNEDSIHYESFKADVNVVFGFSDINETIKEK